MMTEKATLERDLPHVFSQKAGQLMRERCWCDRELVDPIHDSRLRETASAYTLLQTEKGS